jgi:hypothetical protein
MMVVEMLSGVRHFVQPLSGTNEGEIANMLLNGRTKQIQLPLVMLGEDGTPYWDGRTDGYINIRCEHVSAVW